MEYYSNFIWEKNERKINEDSLCIKQIDKEGKSYLLAVVCDGIGGLAQGENASSFVTECLGREFVRLLEEKRKPTMGQMKRAILRQIYKCHRIVKAYGREKEIRLGTTVSVVLICKKRGFFFHVGDSGIYKGKARLKRITGIHHGPNGTLQQAVGCGNSLRIETGKFRMKRNSVLLLCSDGFYKKAEQNICQPKGLLQTPEDKNEF